MKSENMKKVINPGKGIYGQVYIEITWDGTRLSLHGVEGPTQDGNCKGGCGQITDFELTEYANGWTREKVQKLREIWNRWHLNDMLAGDTTQENYLRENGHGKDYTETCKKLEEAGLLTHEGYTYGTAWLFEAVPEEIILFLRALPDSEKAPAWV